MVLALLPLGLALDVAAASSRCDEFMDSLNEKRTQENHEQILWLETKLSKLNKGQGLGFSVYGVVLDRKTLKNLAIGIVGTMSTVVTTLIALSESDEAMVAVAQDSSVVPCAQLSPAQEAAVVGMFSAFNSSCTWVNLTIGPSGVNGQL